MEDEPPPATWHKVLKHALLYMGKSAKYFEFYNFTIVGLGAEKIIKYANIKWGNILDNIVLARANGKRNAHSARYDHRISTLWKHLQAD